MRNIKLTIEYDGINYHGWQSQSNSVAIQDVVQKAIRKLTNEENILTGASRTDVQVHAYGQVANFVTESTIPPDRFAYALNSVLPGDITIKNSEEQNIDFHSRYDSKGKMYQYLIYNSEHPSAILRNRAYHISSYLDVDQMRMAATLFLGKHDFSAFRSTGSSVKSSKRTIKSVSLTREDEIISFEISGDGFLYNMVRIIVGTLVEVGLGKRTVNSVMEAIDSGDRTKAGKTAPPYGLYLVEVYY